MFGTTVLDMSDFPTRHPYSLGIWQNKIERIMAAWIAELPVRTYYGREVTGFTQDDTGVNVELADGQTAASASISSDATEDAASIRKAAGIDFPGWDATRSNLIAEVEMTEEPELGSARTRRASMASAGWRTRSATARSSTGTRAGAIVTEQQLGSAGEPTLRDLSEALIAVYGTDFGVHSPTWISRFTDMTRQAADYRAGRVLLAGDSAHVHYPAGGQGLSLGVQDAVNLGWKLAQVPRDVPGEPPRHLPARAPPGRRPGAAPHDGPGSPATPGRAHEGPGRGRLGAGGHGGAAQASRRDRLRTGHPL